MLYSHQVDIWLTEEEKKCPGKAKRFFFNNKMALSYTWCRRFFFFINQFVHYFKNIHTIRRVPHPNPLENVTFSFRTDFVPLHSMWFVGVVLQNIADKCVAQPGRLSVEISTPNFLISPRINVANSKT